MDQVYQGGQYTARAVYQTSDGALVDPVDPRVSIFDPTGSALHENEALVRDDIGLYHLTFMVPAGAMTGEWSETFLGTINGDDVIVEDNFTVLDSGVVTALASTVTRLRLMLGERIPAGKTEADTRFADVEIANALYFNNEDINKTMAELWLAKAGMWAEAVDIAESGTTREFSQMQRAAIKQAQIYIDRVVTDDAAWSATYRVVGESFDAFGCIPRPRWLWEPVTVRG